MRLRDTRTRILGEEAHVPLLLLTAAIVCALTLWEAFTACLPCAQPRLWSLAVVPHVAVLALLCIPRHVGSHMIGCAQQGWRAYKSRRRRGAYADDDLVVADGLRVVPQAPVCACARRCCGLHSGRVHPAEELENDSDSDTSDASPTAPASASSARRMGRAPVDRALTTKPRYVKGTISTHFAQPSMQDQQPALQEIPEVKAVSMVQLTGTPAAAHPEAVHMARGLSFVLRTQREIDDNGNAQVLSNGQPPRQSLQRGVEPMFSSTTAATGAAPVQRASSLLKMPFAYGEAAEVGGDVAGEVPDRGPSEGVPGTPHTRHPFQIVVDNTANLEPGVRSYIDLVARAVAASQHAGQAGPPLSTADPSIPPRLAGNRDTIQQPISYLHTIASLLCLSTALGACWAPCAPLLAKITGISSSWHGAGMSVAELRAVQWLASGTHDSWESSVIASQWPLMDAGPWFIVQLGGASDASTSFILPMSLLLIAALVCDAHAVLQTLHALCYSSLVMLVSAATQCCCRCLSCCARATRLQVHYAVPEEIDDARDLVHHLQHVPLTLGAGTESIAVGNVHDMRVPSISYTYAMLSMYILHGAPWATLFVLHELALIQPLRVFVCLCLLMRSLGSPTCYLTYFTLG
ncbi:MAG: hypothetical protein EOO65_03430, partial [Methanosarcinales archaeon]